MHLKSINICFIFHDKILYLTAGQHLDLPEEVVVRVRQSVEVSLRKRLTSLLLYCKYIHTIERTISSEVYSQYFGICKC